MLHSALDMFTVSFYPKWSLSPYFQTSLGVGTRDSVGEMSGQSSLLYKEITFSLKHNNVLWNCWISDLVITAFGNTQICVPFNPSSQLFINLNPVFITISHLFTLFLFCHKISLLFVLPTLKPDNILRPTSDLIISFPTIAIHVHCPVTESLHHSP